MSKQYRRKTSDVNQQSNDVDNCRYHSTQPHRLCSEESVTDGIVDAMKV